MKLSRNFLKLNLNLIYADKDIKEKILDYEESKDHHNLVDIIELRYFYESELRRVQRREKYLGKQEQNKNNDYFMETLITKREEAFGK